MRSDYRKFTDLRVSVVHWRAEVAQESAKYALNLAPRAWFPDVKLLHFVFCIFLLMHSPYEDRCA